MAFIENFRDLNIFIEILADVSILFLISHF